MKTVFLLFVFLSIFSPIIAQEMGFPFIRNYIPKEYGGSGQVWTTVQDQRGILYFGDEDGILEYDGKTWRKMYSEKKGSVRCLLPSPQGRMYVGSTAHFGYLDYDHSGKVNYQNLLSLVDTTLKVGIIWSVKQTQKYVYFQLRNGIIEYDPLANKVKLYRVPNSKSRFGGDFVFQDRYYVRLGDYGLLKTEKDTLSLASSFFLNKNTFKTTALWDKDSLLLPTHKEGVYLFNPKNGYISPKMMFSDTSFMADNSLAFPLNYGNNKYFLFASSKKGGVLFDKKGQILQEFNETKLLQDNNVYEIYKDKTHNLWFALNNGISKSEHSQDLSFWNKHSGLKGTVFAMLRFEGKLYICTSSGIYYMENSQIREVKNAPIGQCWALFSYTPPNEKPILLAGTLSGLYQINGTEAQQIRKGGHAFTIYQAPSDPNRIFSTEIANLVAMRYEKGKWIDEGIIKGVKEEIRMMVEDSEKNLWLGTYGNGIVRVTFGDSLRNPKKISFYKEKEGLPSMRYVYPFLIKGKIIFGNEYGIYAHNPKNDRFEPYCELDSNLCNRTRDIVKMYESATGEIWILPYKNKFADLGYLKPQKNKSYEWIYKPFRRLPEMEMEFIYPEKDGIVWIGGTEGLFRYDSQKDLKNYEADFQTLIRKVSIGEDSVIYYGHPSSFAEIENSKGFAQGLDYSYNHIKFEFAAPFFDQEEKTLYSYQLEGFDGAWSDWTSEGVAKYTYLLEGEYVFKVKARNIYDQESSIASYSFRISPPFYRTWWAYGIYAILAAFGVFGIVKWNTLRLEKDKIRLEKIVKERTAEVMLQKEEIQQQAEEIMVQRDNILETYQNNKMLSEIGYRITSTLDLEIILETIYENIEKLMPTDVFGIGLYDEENQKIHYQLAIENGKKYKPYSREMIDKNQFPVWCIENRKEVFINDVEAEYGNYLSENMDQGQQELEDGSISEKTHSLIYLPLLSQNKVLGIITVQSYKNNTYSEWHKSMLGTLGVYVASALENSKAYREIDSQKHKVEQHHKNVMDSINVAKRIQKGMLLSLPDFQQIIPDSFLLFKPRDVVSGDFYWAAQIEKEGKKYTVFTVADCTGHGVPGAFLSVVGCNILNNLVIENQITEPNRILSLLDKEVRKTLQQDKEGGKEGMDMAIITIENLQGLKDHAGLRLEYAGAMNPLYYAQNGELTEIKATKLPIGGEYEGEKTFQLHTVFFEQDQKDLNLYLCSDGYQDQFGGEQNRKFMVKKLRELLLSVSPLPMDEQYKVLDETFEDWKGKKYQVDDVTIVGIRV